MIKKIFLISLVTCISGCATTTDPRKGGLFSYNPDVYEERLEERRDKLLTVEEINKQEKNRLLQLRKNAALETAEQDWLEHKIDYFNDKIVRLEEQIKRANATNTNNKEKSLQIKNKLFLLKRELNKLMVSASPEELNAKKKEYETLIQKLEILTQEAEFF